MFYFFNNPRSTFTDNYVVLVCLVYCVTGMAYALAIYFQPAPAQLVHTRNSTHDMQIKIATLLLLSSNKTLCFGFHIKCSLFDRVDSGTKKKKKKKKIDPPYLSYSSCSGRCFFL